MLHCIYVVQFIDYTGQEINWVEEKFGIDFSIMKHYEDIEISSHFLENEKQVAFHFSIPFYNEEKKIVEGPVFFIISGNHLFLFSGSAVDDFFNKTYSNKFAQLQNSSGLKSIFKFQVEFISDYYADITESVTKKIKALASTILLEKKFSNEVMDVITEYNSITYS